MGFPLADCRNGCQKKNVPARPCHHFQGHSSPPDAHTGNRAPVTSMEGLYDATTLCVLAMWVKSCMLPSCLSFTKHHHPVQLRCPASSTHTHQPPPHSLHPTPSLLSATAGCTGEVLIGALQCSQARPGHARPGPARQARRSQTKPGQARRTQTRPDQVRPGQRPAAIN